MLDRPLDPPTLAIAFLDKTPSPVCNVANKLSPFGRVGITPPLAIPPVAFGSASGRKLGALETGRGAGGAGAAVEIGGRPSTILARFVGLKLPARSLMKVSIARVSLSQTEALVASCE